MNKAPIPKSMIPAAVAQLLTEPRNRHERRRLEAFVRRMRNRRRTMENGARKRIAYYTRQGEDRARRRKISEDVIPLFDVDEHGRHRFVRYL